MRLLATLTLVSASALGAEPHALTVKDLWAVKRVSLPALSSDGRLVAYTVTSYDVEENRGNGDLWLVPLAGGTPRRLTTHKATDSSPVFSPDGTRLAFVAKRDDDKAAQLYVLPLGGGEAERVTELPLGISDPRWLPDGKGLVFASNVIADAESPEATKQALEAREKSKLKARVTDSRLYRFWDRWLTDGEYPHLFVLDLETRKLRDLLPGSRRYFGLTDDSASYDIAPDGRSLVFAAQSALPPYRTLNSDLFLVQLEGGLPRNLTSANPADDDNPTFSPDGRSIVYTCERKADGWPDYARLALLDVTTARSRLLTDGWEQSIGGASFTKDGQTLVFTSEARARTNIYTLPLTGGTPREIVKGGGLSGVQPTPDGQLVFQRHTLTQPAELFATALDGSGLRQLTDTNAALRASWKLGAVREYTFKGASDEDVQMYVVEPPDFDPSRKYPLVHLVHGGPVGTFGDEFGFRWNPHAFAAPGYLVAMVNFHGSSSFGQRFVESILGAHPDKPFTDIQRATDFLIAQGHVDETRMAAAGGSYGGFLVNWIAGHTDRFKALVSHAGVYSLTGQSASDSTYGRHHSYGGYPFTNLANVERFSPNRFSAAFKTPMLILHGERDFRVPVTQGLELYGVLTAKGVPARLSYYPDEGHWILKPQNSRHWYGEVLGWLERWLK